MSKIEAFLPYPLAKKTRQALHFGPRRCPVCGSRIRKYRDAGYGFEVLERLQVVGGMKRGSNRCPVCLATSRERLVWFWLSDAGKGFRLGHGITTAHFAPERGLSKRLIENSQTYSAFDLDPAIYGHVSDVRKADLSDLSHLPQEHFDLVVCNHVIEHVPDVNLALTQLLSIMKNGATAIVQVPISMKLETSIELALDSTEAERIEKVGQHDHLRLMTRSDYVEHLQKAGFAVEEYDAFEDQPQAALRWALDPFEILFVVRKPL
ncbi:MAG: class I SAM-dependent methyltransferase [Pseudomonadota bacterium]